MLKHRRTTTPTPTRELGLCSTNTLSCEGSTTKRSASVPPILDRTVDQGLMASKSSVCSEHCLVAARASVVVFDDLYKKWISTCEFPSGVSKVQIFHDPINRTYRVVGRRIHDKEVTLNTMVTANIKYSEATPTFHQWRDCSRRVFGLNFSNKDDATTFSKCMLVVLNLLQHTEAQQESTTPIDQQLHIDVPDGKSAHAPGDGTAHNSFLLTASSSNQQIASPAQNVERQQQGVGARHAEYSTPTQLSDYHTPVTIVTSNNSYRQPEPGHTLPQVRATSVADPTQSFAFQAQTYQQPGSCSTYQPVTGSTIPQYEQQSLIGSCQRAQQIIYDEPSDSVDADIHSSTVITSAPALGESQNVFRTGQAKRAEAPCAANAVPGPPPPPPAPPIPAGGIPSISKLPAAPTESSQAAPMSSLAAAIQSTTLKKTPKVETCRVPPSLVGSKSMLMEEMQKKLASRKAKLDGEDTLPSTSCSSRSSPFHNPRSNTASPMSFAKNCTKQGSFGDSWQDGLSAETLPAELQQLKNELIVEIRKDLYQFKCNILAAIKEEASNYK